MLQDYLTSADNLTCVAPVTIKIPLIFDSYITITNLRRCVMNNSAIHRHPLTTGGVTSLRYGYHFAIIAMVFLI